MKVFIVGEKKGITYLIEARCLLSGVPRTLLKGSPYYIVFKKVRFLKKIFLPWARNFHNVVVTTRILRLSIKVAILTCILLKYIENGKRNI